MAPDVKDIRALAVALKLHGVFETVDRLAQDWVERGERNLKPEDLESDERRKWYDLSDSWENNVARLKNAVSKFQEENYVSPILRYHEGKVFLGFDSPQAKGYRIVTLEYPAWFTELGLPTENYSEDAVYRLVSVERLSDEAEATLRKDFVEDLRVIGVERFTEYMPRYESTMDRRLTYNDNVFRVERLVEAIKRERALVIPTPPGLPAVVAPPPVAPSAVEVKPLLTPEDVQRIHEYFTMGLSDAGVDPAKYEEDFKKAVDTSKTWEENTDIMDTLVEKIVASQPAPSTPKIVQDEFDKQFNAAMDEWLPMAIEQHKSGLAGNLHYDAPQFEAETLAKFTPEGVKQKYGAEIEKQLQGSYEFYLNTETPEAAAHYLKRVPEVARALAYTWTEKLYKQLLNEALEKAKATRAPPPSVAARRGLSGEDMKLLLAFYNNEFFRNLGKVPPNSAATFRVEFEKLKDKTFDEAKERIVALANDIIEEFRAREKVRAGVPIYPVRLPRVPEEEMPAVVGRVPPAQFPSFPLSYDMPFPRGPTSKEREPLWRAFQYKMQQEGYDAAAYLDQFEAYIMGAQFLSWEDLREKFDFFITTIMSGRQLPPLEQWQGYPIPTGLKGLIMEKPELEKLEDLIVHYSSVVIRNKRSKGDVPTLENLRDELVERGVITADTPLAELRDAAKTAITRAVEKQDIWMAGITTTEINDFLAS